MNLSLAESSASSLVANTHTSLLRTDSVAYAVLKECRYRTLTVAVIVSRKLDEEMCEMEAAMTAEHASPRRNSVDVSNCSSPHKRVEEHSESADNADPDRELSLFIPTVDTETTGSASQSEREMFSPGNAGEASPGRILTNKGRGWIDTRTFAPFASLGGTETSDQFFPRSFGRWECGTFLGRRVFIEADNTFLGRGSLALVFGGNLVVTETVGGEEKRLISIPVAVKGIVYDAREKAVRNMLEDALKFRLEVTHPGFVHVFHSGCYFRPFSSFSAAAKQPSYLHLSLACSKTGSIADVLKREGTFAESDVKQCMAEVLTALQFLHETHRQVHNDVKSHNILLFDSATVFPTDFTYQLTDFTGLTHAQTPKEVQWKLHCGLHEQLIMDAVGGTAAFMSPEGCLGLGMLTSNDIWSLGITAYHMATNTLPWKPLERQFPSMILNGFRCKYSAETLFNLDGSELRGASSATTLPDKGLGYGADADGNQSSKSGGSSKSSNVSSNSAGSAVLHEKYNDFGPLLEEFNQSTLSEDFKDFVRKCLVENPVERPTAGQLLEHAFVKGIQVGLSREPCTTTLTSP